MSRALPPPGAGRLSLWLGGAALALVVFARITGELIEGDAGSVDSAILHFVARIRTPWLTVAAVDVTALGSITLVILFSAFALLVPFVLRDRMGPLQFLAVSVRVGILTIVTKDIIERARPTEVPQLIVASGFSFPSGHSVSTAALHLTTAIIACGYVRHPDARSAIFIALSAVPVIVGASRVYLGVHYATDVVSGISLGAAWALMLAGSSSLFVHRGAREVSTTAA